MPPENWLLQEILDIINKHLVLRNGTYITNTSPYKISKEIYNIMPRSGIKGEDVASRRGAIIVNIEKGL